MHYNMFKRMINGGQSMKEQIEYAQMSLAESIKSLYAEKELLAKVIDCFPYPIQVKKHTGMTPHGYYTSYKISKLKEKLLDTNLTIE